jgi:hypothetical protein
MKSTLAFAMTLLASSLALAQGPQVPPKELPRVVVEKFEFSSIGPMNSYLFARVREWTEAGDQMEKQVKTKWNQHDNICEDNAGKTERTCRAPFDDLRSGDKKKQQLVAKFRLEDGKTVELTAVTIEKRPGFFEKLFD